MNIVNTLTLESNRQIKINFDGGDLSSDAGLFLIKEFAAKIGFIKLVKKKFKTNDKSVRFHKDHENLLQMIYQIISAYFQDDCADELTWDPVFHAILDKESLASQPTLSRFFNCMDEDTLIQDLHDVCGFRTDYQFITKSKMRNIQKKIFYLASLKSPPVPTYANRVCSFFPQTLFTIPLSDQKSCFQQHVRCIIRRHHLKLPGLHMPFVTAVQRS